MKTLGILAAVVALLLGILIVQRVQRGKIVVSGPAEVVRVEPDKVTRVEIHKADGDVELVRTGDAWKLTRPAEYPANPELVNGMLKAVEELKLVDVISSNPANRSTYQVDSTGTAVTIWSGESKTLDVVVGKSTADWTHTFVRRADRDEVYRADGVLSYNFNRRPDDWRDKSVLRLEPLQIQRIALENLAEGETVSLVRADSTHWSVQSGSGTAAADSATAARVVASVAKLDAAAFATATEAAAADWTSPDFRLRVDAGGTPHTVTFVAVDDAKMLARRDGADTIFSLYKSNLMNVMKTAHELRTGQAPPPPAGKKAKKNA
jgi:hypothetical protein